jgi:predicted secreted Zn-dependent protease
MELETMAVIDLSHFLETGMPLHSGTERPVFEEKTAIAVRGHREKKIALGAAAVLVLSMVFLPRAFAEPKINIQKRYYPAFGQTSAQIRQSLDRNTPVQHNGKPFDAYTKWDVDWQFRWTYDGDGTCRMTAVTTVLHIRQTFPRLENKGALAPQLTRRWERYMIALVEHEAGHAALGIDAARAIERQLLQMGDRSSCDQLESEANALVREIIARYSRLEAQYDADTNYGERDGARFP